LKASILGVYHRKSLLTGSWDIGERLMREMMMPAAPDPALEVLRPELAPVMSLESAVSTFLANLEGENRAPDTIRKYRRSSANFRISPISTDCPQLLSSTSKD